AGGGVQGCRRSPWRWQRCLPPDLRSLPGAPRPGGGTRRLLRPAPGPGVLVRLHGQPRYRQRPGGEGGRGVRGPPQSRLPAGRRPPQRRPLPALRPRRPQRPGAPSRDQRRRPQAGGDRRGVQHGRRSGAAAGTGRGVPGSRRLADGGRRPRLRGAGAQRRRRCRALRARPPPTAHPDGYPRQGLWGLRRLCRRQRSPDRLPDPVQPPLYLHHRAAPGGGGGLPGEPAAGGGGALAAGAPCRPDRPLSRRGPEPRSVPDGFPHPHPAPADRRRCPGDGGSGESARAGHSCGGDPLSHRAPGQRPAADYPQRQPRRGPDRPSAGGPGQRPRQPRERGLMDAGDALSPPPLALHPWPATGADPQPCPLVLLHGWGGDSGAWDELVPLLRERFAVIAVDLPGFGASAPASWTLDGLLAQLALALPPRCLLVGWSLGGMLATAYAHRYPGRVAGLVTLAANASFIQREGWPAAMPPAVFGEFAAGFAADPAATLVQFTAFQARGDDRERAVARALRARLPGSAPAHWGEALG